MTSVDQVYSRLDDMPARIAAAIAEQQQIERARDQERLRTRKIMRIPQIEGTPAGGALSMGGDSGPQRCGPDQGFVWSLSGLSIEGLTSGASQDTVQIFRNSNSGPGRLIWQLTGNQPVSTFGKGQRILFPGEALLVVSVGTFSATGTITLSGETRQVSAERIGEFF